MLITVTDQKRRAMDTSKRKFNLDGSATGQVRFEICLWCKQKCQFLFFNQGCTFECALALNKHRLPRFNRIYSEMTGYFISNPHLRPDFCSLQRGPKETVEEFWSRNINHLYGSEQDLRKNNIRERMNYNKCEFMCESYYQKKSVPVEQQTMPRRIRKARRLKRK